MLIGVQQKNAIRTWSEFQTTLPFEQWEPINYSSFKLSPQLKKKEKRQSQFKKSMIQAGLGSVYWMLRDLKRKGISDAKNKNIGGHKTLEIQQRYNTVIEAFDPAVKGSDYPDTTIVRKI
ncbi:MAG: hypothetical protein ACI8ZB_004506 [Desulforhopalus sp.]|jgi:hypothetical protein